MNTSPQITRVEPTIKIPAWRSASPKNLKTRRPQTSASTCPTNLTSSPKVSIQPLGPATSSPISSPSGRQRSPRSAHLLRDRGDLGMGSEQRLGEGVVEREDAVEGDHHRLVDCPPHAFGATRGRHPLVAADDGDDRPEQRRLQH